MSRKINIGITINISSQNDSLFTNGIRQNIVILRELYKKCKNVQNAYIINVTNLKIEKTSPDFGEYSEHVINLNEAYEKCDLIIVCHGSLLPEEYKTFKTKGIKIVKLALGNQQTTFTENVIFQPSEKSFGIYKRNDNVNYVWMSEHFFENEKNFHEVLNNCEARIAPYVWSPRFIEKHKQTLENEGKNVLYKPTGNKEKRICSFEPNMSIAKNLIIPLLISEKFYRKHPEYLKYVYLFNAMELVKKKDFVDYVKDLEAHKSGKMTFQAGYPIVNILATYTDIVLSHQKDCELNYLYLDAAWLGYPVLHNSIMMKNIGFYYPKNNVEAAIEQLVMIADTFDNNHEEYLKKSRKLAQKYSIDNKKNINNYEILIEEAMK